MDELFQRIHATTGISTETAKSAVAIILNFIRNEGPKEATDKLIHGLPGAEKLIETHGEAASAVATEEEGQSPGLLGGVAAGIANLVGGGGGVLSTVSGLTALGLDMGQIQATLGQLNTYAREKVGDDVVDEVISAIPALARMK